MWLALLRTSRGQAGLALAGVIVLASSVVYAAYLGAEAHERDHYALGLAERQLALTSELGRALAGGEPGALPSGIAAASTNLSALSRAAEAGDSTQDSALRARLSVIQSTWASLAPELGALAKAPPLASRERVARALVPRLTDLLSELAALARGYEQHMTDAMRLNAGRQAFTLAATAPLLCWAYFAISRGARPGAAAQSEPETGAAESVRLPGERHAGQLAPAGLFARSETQSQLEAWAGAGVAPTSAGPWSGASPVRAVTGGQRRGPPGLVQELQQHAADFRQLSGITVELALDERAAESVSPSAQPQALNIAREALANARRHALASRVSISLWQEAGWIWLAVSHDGASRAPWGEHDEQLGLSIMRARAERIGGELRISAREGQGTAVMARLPIGEQAGAGEPFGARVGRSPRRAW